MNNTPRYLETVIRDDLMQKMVFLGGPRQVGKTTLSKQILEKGLYLNWDNLLDRQQILNFNFSLDQPLIIFDELHKYRLWRSLTKGLYDKYFPEMKILVTGSARLDHFRKGGDSLVGRYHYHRLHPFTLPELSKDGESDIVASLLRFGGFPEPFLKQEERHHKRWMRERISRVVTQDLIDLERVKDVSLVELLVELLPKKVGSLLSIANLVTDLQVSPNTVSNWITILENLYYCYRIYPYGKSRAKAVKKAPKLFLWDWSQIQDPGSRFENMIASHLLKYCHYEEDVNGEKMQLCFIKDVENQKEIDFVVLKNNTPMFAVECKTGEKSLNKNLAFYQGKLDIPKIYQVHLGSKDFGLANKGGRVLSLSSLCIEEKLV
jgi:uncharacterized protein